MRRWHVLVEPTVPILLLASIVHVVRHNVVDLAVFGGTAVLIVIDGWRSERSMQSSHDGGSAPGRAPQTGHHHGGRSGTRRGTAGGIAAVAVFAVVSGVLPRSGWAMQLLMIVLGLALAALALVPQLGASPVGRRFRRVPDVRAPGWSAWAIVGVLACLWELTAFAFQQADPAAESSHPTVSDLVDPLLTSPVGRIVFAMIWGAAGVWLIWHLLRSRATP